ncbi:hypothetical protein RM844_30560 [Streptomyces sp. DSM 44915]|uniref:Helix-turn-helix domain-containing protein n=1 Tax=Streptomyces chisholmiae TaxID=3075540 RepID=A0ABU2K0W0_9ACTN|nr:hypothetical protein [Streptomyces sp. DSM 44915]MDT0270624.1 hypothetical protein [Streptomyces sp. DSM 44915]
MTTTLVDPAEAPPGLTDLIARLAAGVEALAGVSGAALELKFFTPEEAAPILGKTPNWVIEACQNGRIPCTYVGKSPRLTARHLRLIAEANERTPKAYAPAVRRLRAAA